MRSACVSADAWCRVRVMHSVDCTAPLMLYHSFYIVVLRHFGVHSAITFSLCHCGIFSDVDAPSAWLVVLDGTSGSHQNWQVSCSSQQECCHPISITQILRCAAPDPTTDQPTNIVTEATRKCSANKIHLKFCLLHHKMQKAARNFSSRPSKGGVIVIYQQLYQPPPNIYKCIIVILYCVTAKNGLTAPLVCVILTADLYSSHKWK